jgi:hypothetical protein
MQGGRGDTRAARARQMPPRDLIRRGMFTLLVASVLHVIGAEARARSCVERPLGEYSVIFGARIVQKLPNNKMILAIEHNFRGNETRETLIVDYGNVMVWTDRNVFKPRAKWLFAFQEKAKEYDIVLCKTVYVPIENGKLSVNIDGSGYRNLTVGQLSRRLAEKSE